MEFKPNKTEELLALLKNTQPQSVASPLSLYDLMEARSKQLSPDPVISKLQKFGRGVQGLLEPETPLDYLGMAVPFGKAGTIITKPVYHATDKVFDTFKKSKGKRGMGVSFAVDPNNAKVYGKNLKELDISKAKLWDFRNKNDVDKLIKEVSDQHEIALKNPYDKKSISFGPYGISSVKKGIRDGNALFLELDGVSNAIKKLRYDGHIGFETMGKNKNAFLQGKVFEPDLIEIKK